MWFRDPLTALMKEKESLYSYNHMENLGISISLAAFLVWILLPFKELMVMVILGMVIQAYFANR